MAVRAVTHRGALTLASLPVEPPHHSTFRDWYSHKPGAGAHTGGQYRDFGAAILRIAAIPLLQRNRSSGVLAGRRTPDKGRASAIGSTPPHRAIRRTPGRPAAHDEYQMNCLRQAICPLH